MTPTGSAYGLELQTEIPLAGTLPPAGTGPLVSVGYAAPEELDRWSQRGVSTLSREASPDGAAGLALEYHPALGFRVLADPYGQHVVAAGGSSIRCAPPEDVEPWRLEHFILGQLLPLAALLNGLEGFHASAVVLQDRLIALTGPSGGGKSTLALHLVARGGSFFTDDVLVLSGDGPPLCQPGPRATNVHDPVLLERALASSPPFGAILGSTRTSARVLVSGQEWAPRPLAALYLLDRRSEAPALTFSSLSQPYPLIASTYNFAIRTSERLARQLDACARIASSAALYRVTAPASIGAEELAVAIENHATS